ncbi:hypothetical protein MKX03_035496 [Papaver bracteatum]|nr:hypothetical protein MKX03_035496 [Papaver bracteatum]
MANVSTTSKPIDSKANVLGGLFFFYVAPFPFCCTRYYCFLVLLTLPVLVVGVYFHWLGIKHFKHA